MRQRRVLCALLTLWLPVALWAESADRIDATAVSEHPEMQGALAAIDAWIDGVQHYERVPGLSVGVVIDQELVWHRGYGVSNLETQRPADADTIYSICSISKLFTSIGMMQLRDQGLLRLDDPVGDHLDWFDLRQAHAGSGPVTLESLITHSSGLPRESDFPYWEGPDFPFPTREEMIARLESQETLYPSQRLFQYSNLALSLAGEVVQARSGDPFDAYVRSNILEPLGLDDTRPEYPTSLRGEQLAIGYTGIDRRRDREPVEPFYTRGVTPAAGFTSTVRDLARFASWQFRLLDATETEVLAPNTLREMHRVHWVDPDWQTTWGLGFSVRRSGDLTVVGHGGGCPGYITQFAMVPERKLAAIVLTNAGDGPAGQVANGMLKVLSKALAASGEESSEKMPDLSEYEGNFDMQPWGGDTAVRQWGDQLALISLPADDLSGIVRLRRREGDVFVRVTEAGAEREPWIFERDDSGRVVRIRRHSIALQRFE